MSKKQQTSKSTRLGKKPGSRISLKKKYSAKNEKCNVVVKKDEMKKGNKFTEEQIAAFKENFIARQDAMKQKIAAKKDASNYKKSDGIVKKDEFTKKVIVSDEQIAAAKAKRAELFAAKKAEHDARKVSSKAAKVATNAL